MKITKTGWQYDHDTGAIRDDDGELIATVETGYEPHGDLIAAAPELLEALILANDIVNSYAHIPALFRACVVMQDAISKAKPE